MPEQRNPTMTTRTYREHYRRQFIGAGYSGRAHLGFVLAFSLGGLAVSIGQIEAVRALEWLTVPLAFVYANLAEYLGHRFVMHRKVPGLGLIYKRHAGQHHVFFTRDHMALDDWRDAKAVLFPPILMIFFFGVFATPVALLLAWMFSANVAWLFLATGLAYYLNYELLHLAYHLPEGSRWLRLPFLSRLRRLHHVHHDTALMASRNFNITYPIGDWLFRTRA